MAAAVGPLSRLILKRVMRSALSFESQSVTTYTGLLGTVRNGRSCSNELRYSLYSLLAEAEPRRKILQHTVAGRLSLSELESLLNERAHQGNANVQTIDADTLGEWSKDLSAVLQHEEMTWVFCDNLQRVSRTPSDRRTFEALAVMEKEHVDTLRKLPRAS
jgi:uncharacterized membrane protein